MTVVTDYTALISGDSWNGLEIKNKPAVVTFSFASTAPPADAANVENSVYSTFQPMTQNQQNEILQALNEWGNASGITFVEVKPGASDITFSTYDFSNSSEQGAGGEGYYPFGDWNYYSYPQFFDGWAGAGDVLMTRADETSGLFAYTTVLHEIGHALGLKHPTQDFDNGASGVDHNQVLATDDGTATVMTEQPNTLQHLTALDIAAVQSMYGTNAMDGSEYAAWTYNSTTNSFTFDALAAGGFVRGSAVNDTMVGSAHADTMVGLYGNDSLSGGGDNDALFGGSGNDTLDGGAGADTLYGGKDNDTYFVDNTGDVIIEFAGEGTDLVNTTVSYTLPDNVENLTLTANNINGTGNALDNVIHGNNGVNILQGLDGNDSLLGAGGNDSLDGGNGNDYLDGGTGNNTLTGDAGNDTLMGSGVETMHGGAGNDTYYVMNIGDVVSEQTTPGTDDGGTDLVYSMISYTLPDFVENLTLQGTNNLGGTGNALNNSIHGNNGNDVLSGLDGNDSLLAGTGNDSLDGGTGNDYLDGGSGSDTLHGGDGNDSILGGAGGDLIYGDAGDDTLNSGADADTLYGGAGNDVYYVDNINDVVLEQTTTGVDDGGHDIVYSTAAGFTLSAFVEDLTLQGTNNINGTGNNLDNVIHGNNANNVLIGLDGNDSLSGGGGNDSLDGGTGNDYLDGGSGNDTILGGTGNDTLMGQGIVTMHGGAGNDTYYVANAADVVSEETTPGVDDGGTDIVYASISYTLTDFVENLTLTGTVNLNGTGNALANIIHGNNGNNVLTGLDGNDSLLGGGGNDNLIGGNGNDYLDAGDGNDTLVGGAGNDSLIGGSGPDQFVFAAAGTANGVDRVYNFIHGTDELMFTGTDYGFTAGHTLTSAEFTVGTAAVGTAAQFVWNSTTNTLYWDHDGAGGDAAVAIASFAGTVTIDHTDVHFT